MIIFAGRVHTEPEAVVALGRRSWRTVWEVTTHGIGMCRQMRFGAEPWRDCGTGYAYVTVSRRFAVGRHHTWYDGPHCGLSLGFLRFAWSLGACRKCEVGR